jgi:hypothetical protein
MDFNTGSQNVLIVDRNPTDNSSIATNLTMPVRLHLLLHPFIPQFLSINN